MIIESAFKPPWFLANRHLQTLWGTFFHRVPPLPAASQRTIELDDGDFIEIESFGNEAQPRVMLLHGLEGSSNSHYIRGLVHQLLAHDYRVKVMHFRGCGQRDNRLARSYHSGVSDDLQEVIEKLSQQNIQIQHIIGFSLGGNVLLKWLGEQGENAPIKSAVAVSVPLCLDICATAIDKGFAKLYQWHLLRTLRRKALTKKAIFPKAPLPENAAIKKLANFWQFDDQITAPLNGFNNAKDYYEAVSSRQYLKSVRTRTLIIQSRDDPFMTEAVLPKESELSEAVTLEVSDKGGHVGFVSKTSVKHFLDSRIVEFIANK